MKQLLYIFIGGGLGSSLRYLLSLFLNRGGAIAWHTFTANVVGCAIIGMTMSLLSKNPEHWLRYLVVIGFCGGFTTFSTFSFETVNLIKSGQQLTGIIYIWISMIGCMSATILGIWLGNFISNH